MQSGLIGLGLPVYTHPPTHNNIYTNPLLSLYPFLSILKEPVVPHPLHLSQVGVSRLECASGLSPGLADCPPDPPPSPLNLQMIKTRTSSTHPTDIQTFALMLAGRANLITILPSPLSHHPSGVTHLDFTFIYSFSLSLCFFPAVIPTMLLAFVAWRFFNLLLGFFLSPLLCFCSFLPCQGYPDHWLVLMWLSRICICLFMSSPHYKKWCLSVFL